MPTNAAIYELPYVAYPESPPPGVMLDYDLARGFIHTTDGLTWSYGAMKGRPQDWAEQAQGMPMPTLIPGLVAAGFSGIYIDRYGYTDGAKALSAQIEAVTGAPPILSRDQRLEFFNLRPFAARLRASATAAELASLGHAILHPPVVALGTGFYGDENGSRWAVGSASAAVTNPTDKTEEMVFSSRIHTLAKGKWRMAITTPGNVVHHVVIGQKPTTVQFTFAVPPGLHPVTFASSVPPVLIPTDPRTLAVRYDDLVLGDASLAPFASGALPPAAH
jgi:phosphoglycerol transferase